MSAVPFANALPAVAPHTNHPVIRAMARGVLRLFGWKLLGTFPNVPRVLIIAAPHSSAWDAIWGLLIKVAIGLDIEFMAKKEIFFFPLGLVLRLLGGVPVDRHAANGVVGATVQALRSKPVCWVVLAPEGTRRRVERWRTGFWHIARQADVPVCCLYLHYPEKTFGIGPVLEMSDDMHADIAKLRAYYEPFQGKHRKRN
ncbi:MAG: 1-acyl-sn-glycerol-3-phosphate acyltransferase [Pseudomonadota bacterium]|nr:1-acyl-sn-glycerol-3-phosphate acyltransferase [Pseudomonadota bacterium]